MLQSPEHVFESTQWIPKPVDEVFKFFSDENNLEEITPPWLRFNVVDKSTPQIGEGTLINYRLKLYGIPMRWRTRIEEWEPGRKFVDTQLIGPYTLWHHTHTFAAENGGTRMNDRVRYRLPLGRLGDLVAHWKIKRQVRDIFKYRTEVIEKTFGG